MSSNPRLPVSFRSLLPPFLALALALAAGATAPAAAQVQLLPDPCTSALTPGQVATTNLSLQLSVRSTPGSLAGKKLALLVNGNGFGEISYRELASHLARNGMVAAIFVRPGSSTDVDDLFEALDDVLAHLGWSAADPDLDIALVGHSMGGRVAIEAARANQVDDLGYPLRVVATLAPVASTTTVLDGWDIGAYLTLYGSQDEDTDAYDGTVNEAFFSYDSAGTEGSTTCNLPPCVGTSPAFQKTMVFAYGADHAGLVGVGDSLAVEPQDLDYLSPADTLCITKAYVTGFLRFHLWGDAIYKGMLRGEWKPFSVAAIDTAEADGFGNPAGAPLRLFFQTSPTAHKTIQSFTSSAGTFTKSADAAVQHAAAGAFSGSPFRVRHNTGMAMVGWDGADASQWVRFAVPAGSRDGSTYSHFSLRIGQLNGAPSPFDNPVNANQSVWVGLEDAGGAISWHQLTGIPAPDRYTAGGTIKAQSHLATRRISTVDIDDIDLSDVRAVRLFFSAHTHGTVMVDSLEWHRD